MTNKVVAVFQFNVIFKSRRVRTENKHHKVYSYAANSPESNMKHLSTEKKQNSFIRTWQFASDSVKIYTIFHFITRKLIRSEGVVTNRLLDRFPRSWRMSHEQRIMLLTLSQWVSYSPSFTRLFEKTFNANAQNVNRTNTANVKKSIVRDITYINYLLTYYLLNYYPILFNMNKPKSS